MAVIMRLLLNSWMVMISLVLSCHHLAEGFSSPSSVLYKQQPTLRRLQQQQSFSTMLYLVTEDDVLEAVETAEKLWAEALEARKTANALSDRAEEEAEAAATQANEANEALLTANKEKIPVTLEQLAQGDAVARSSLDAGSMVNRALQASDEADRLEKSAEEALKKSEEQFEQHLEDFPDSPLAE